MAILECAKSRFAVYCNARVLSHTLSSAIKYTKHGDPLEVLEMTRTELPSDLGPSDVRVSFLAAPIHMADLNMIQGTYAVKPNLPAVAGNEGVAKVIQVGSAVKDFCVGDWVFPTFAGYGTWRTQAILPERILFKLDNRLDLEAAAILAVNPCTAYRMLRDFQKLSPGECVIQNGANSGVGRAVIQVAKHMGLVTVNVIRNRDGVADLIQELTQLGASYVILEEELRSPKVSELWKKLGEPRLGLNCVGGKNATDLMCHLANKASLVTYGGMSRQPLTVPTESLIFKDIRILGFWLSQWIDANERSIKRYRMMSELTDMCLKGKLKPSNYVHVPLQNFKQVMIDSTKPLVTQKHLFVMDEVDSQE